MGHIGRRRRSARAGRAGGNALSPKVSGHELQEVRGIKEEKTEME